MPPPPEDATLAMFAGTAEAAAAARAPSGGGVRIALPDALLVEHATTKELSELQARGARVVGNTDAALVKLSCTAASANDARAIEREVRDYTDLQGFVHLAPWHAPPTPEQARARRTLRLAENGLEDTAAPGELDERVLRLYSAKPAPTDTATEEWRRNLASLLGGEASTSEARTIYPNVVLLGPTLKMTLSTRSAAPREAIMIARYLCAKGCRDVSYELVKRGP